VSEHASRQRVEFEFDSQFIRIEVTRENLYLEEMPAIVRLDI